MSVMAAVGRTFIYASSRLKKYSIRPNRSIRASLLARTSLIAYDVYRLPSHTTDSKTMLTWRRTPMPVNIAFAGGNACGHTHQRVALGRHNVSRFTTPTPLPTVAENANRTLTVGSSHLCPLFIGTLRSIKGLYLGSKNGKNSTGRIAGLQLGG